MAELFLASQNGSRQAAVSGGTVARGVWRLDINGGGCHAGGDHAEPPVARRTHPGLADDKTHSAQAMTTAPPRLLDRLAVLLGTGLGVGHIPGAPGTVGTLWGIPLAWAILTLPQLVGQLAAIAGLCALGVPVCGRAARCLGKKDPGSVVWDELAALPIVYLGLAPQQMLRLPILLAGFLLFRVFDISKLPPGRQAERLPGGWGIMADDVVAALYAWLVLTGLRWWIPWFKVGG
jgi:phosphatidylglycerophosphatase A